MDKMRKKSLGFGALAMNCCFATCATQNQPKNRGVLHLKSEEKNMSKLSLLDLAFFVAESDASPKHVAGLLIFKRPKQGRQGFPASSV
jgi:hypothetical protein